VPLALTSAFVSSTWAQADSNALAACAKIGAAADRLVCYDKLAGRAAPEAPITPASATSPEPTSKLAPVDTAAAKLPQPASEGSLMSKFWELDDTDKRGVFNFTGYRANYVLPFHKTSRINRAPQSPTQAAVSQPNYRSVEAKFQISLRTKVLQDVGLPGGDVWLAFTEQAMWQIWNGRDSKPFRNTDYEPEVIYVAPVPKSWRDLPFGWQWRFGQFGLAHQSNGQSDPLSRSWNRVYLGTGFERGDWTVTARGVQRLNEPYATDNNPDLIDYRGRAELQLGWTPGAATTSLLYRSTLQNAKYGALQFEWTYPLNRNQPNGVRWFVQAFRGYGETLTDYNFRQTSIGAGLTFMQF
jgi:phospholipase A1